MAKLVLHRLGSEMREVILDQDRVTIGRRADHDICLPFPAVSADHAEIITVVADSFLHDLGSTNGTFVNGERVTKHFLRDRDRIDIGRQQLVYLVNESETIDPLPAETPIEKAPTAPPKPAGGLTRAASAARPSGTRIAPRDPRLDNVDDLMTDLMEMDSDSTADVDLPNVDASPASAEPWADQAESSAAVVEILTGPNAGQVAPLHKPEFLFGKLGATVAAIRREGSAYRLVAIDRRAMPLVNGQAIAPEGAVLGFGDMIDVAGVKLRFDRAA